MNRISTRKLERLVCWLFGLLACSYVALGLLWFKWFWPWAFFDSRLWRIYFDIMTVIGLFGWGFILGHIHGYETARKDQARGRERLCG